MNKNLNDAISSTNQLLIDEIALKNALEKELEFADSNKKEILKKEIEELNTLINNLEKAQEYIEKYKKLKTKHY